MRSLLILMVVLAGSAFADVTFYAYSPTEVHTFSDLLTYISFFFNKGTDSGDAYFSLLRFIVIFGTLMTVVWMAKGVSAGAGQAHRGIFDFVAYYIFFVGMLMVMFARYENVIVKDENTGTIGVSAQVPYLFAETVSFFSRFRQQMTEISEYIYDDIRTPGTAGWDMVPYGLGGLGYGGTAEALNSGITLTLREVDKHDFDSKRTAPMFSTVLTECVVTPLSSTGAGTILPTDIYYSSDIIGMIDNIFAANPAFRNIPLERVYYGNDNCGDLWDDLKGVFNTVVADTNDTVLKDKRVKEYASGLAYIVALSDRSGATATASGDLIADAAKTKEAVLQTILGNETNNLFAKLGVAGNVYAAGANKAIAEIQYSGIGAAVMMQKYLPMLSTMLFAFMIGAFPFMFAFSLLPGGFKILVNFTKTLAWVTLWAPTAAILNFFIDRRLGDLYEQIVPNLSTGSNYMELLEPTRLIDISSDAGTMAGLAGMLYLSVPALTWMLVTGSGYMLSNLTNIISGAFMKNISPDQVLQDAGTMESAKQASLRMNRKVGVAEMAHFETMRTAAAVGGQYAGYRLAMKESGMTLSDFGAAAEVSAAAETTQGYEYAKRVGGGTGAAHVGAVKGAMQGAQDNAYYNSMSVGTGAHIGDVKGGEQLGYDLGKYGNLDRGTATSANYKRGAKAASHDRAYNEHATVDAATGSGRAAGEAEAGVDTAMSETYGRKGSAFETAYKGTLDNEIKKREHYEELTADEIETAAAAAGTLSGKTASKVAKRLKGWRKSGALNRMIEEQSGANAAVETSAYSAASEAADKLQQSNKFKGMGRDEVLADMNEALHFGAASQMAGQVAGAKGMQQIMGGSIGDAMMTTAVENSFWRGAHDAADAAGVKTASAKTVAAISNQDSRTRGTQARLAEFQAYSDDKLSAQEYLDKKRAELKEAQSELEAKEGDLEGVAAKEQKVKDAKSKMQKAFSKIHEAKNSDEQKAAMNEWTAARHEYDAAVQELEDAKEGLQKERMETIESFRKGEISGNEFSSRMHDIARREKGLGQRAEEIEAARANVGRAAQGVEDAEAYVEHVEGRYSAENHGRARYKQTTETAATGRVVGEKGVAGFEHAADLKARTQHETGMEAMHYNARGVSNDMLAESSAVLSMSRAGNYAIAAQNMAASGFLDKVFNRSDAATQQQLMQHGFGEGAVRSLSAIQAQGNYAINTVLDGYDVYMTSDAEGNYGSNMVRKQMGLDARVTYNYDNLSEIGHEMVGDNIGNMATAARVKSGAETVVDAGLAVLPGGKVFRAVEGIGTLRKVGGLRKGYQLVSRGVNLRTYKGEGAEKAAEAAGEAASAPRPEMPNGEVQPGITIKPMAK